MSYKKEVNSFGGEGAMPLTDLTIKNLTSLFGGGGQPSPMSRTTQANPMGKTGDIMSVLSDILSAGGGATGSALSQLIQQRQTSDIGALRERFAGSGVSMGTPAAYAESNYRAKAAPEAASAVGNLQLQTIMPLLQLIGGLSSKGISQRETNLSFQEPDWLTALKGAAGAASGFKDVASGIALL